MAEDATLVGVSRLFQAGLASEQRIHRDSDRASVHAERALVALRAAHDRLPDRPDIAASIARVLDRVGRLDEGLAIVEPYLATSKPWGPVIQAFARMAPRCGQTERAIDLLRRAVSDHPVDSKREPLLYELAVLLDLRGDIDGAFAAAVAANRLTGHRLGGIAVRPLADIVRQLDTRAWSTRPPATMVSELPVFVIGFGRSGKTVLEALLAAHPDVAALGERRLAVPRLVRALGSRMTACGLPTGGQSWTADRLTGAGRAFLAALTAAATGARRAIDTAPENGLVVPALAAALPGARFLHLVRDPRDTCLDMFFHFQKSRLMRTWDLGEGAAALGAYRRLMSLWRQRLGVTLPDVRYERMVADPEGMRRELFHFLRLPPLDRPVRLHRPVVDPAARVDRSTVIEAGHAGRWRRYAHHIGPLLEAFGDGERPLP